MPDNPFNADAGNKARVYAFLKYFNDRGFVVDFFSDTRWGEWTQPDKEKALNSGLIRDLYLVDRRPEKRNFIKYFFVKGWQMVSNLLKGMDTRAMPNRSTDYLCNSIYKIVKNKDYNYVIINYVTWSEIISKKKYFPNAKFIVDTHDFLTSQYQNKGGGKYIGKLFQEEIKRLNTFDQVWTLSTDEQYIFSQFCKNEVVFVPCMSDTQFIEHTTDFEYDLIYIASDNPHNRVSAKWFMDEVYPLLPSDIRICMIGKITKHIEDKENIDKILFAPTLDAYYNKSKISICPMLQGTGVKVKVVEALSFGLPVVCNERGIDGLPNKIDNGCLVTDNPEEFASNICDLINDKEKYIKYKEQSIKMFLSVFDKKLVYRKLDKIFGL